LFFLFYIMWISWFSLAFSPPYRNFQQPTVYNIVFSLHYRSVESLHHDFKPTDHSSGVDTTRVETLRLDMGRLALSTCESSFVTSICCWDPHFVVDPRRDATWLPHSLHFYHSSLFSLPISVLTFLSNSTHVHISFYGSVWCLLRLTCITLLVLPSVVQASCSPTAKNDSSAFRDMCLWTRSPELGDLVSQDLIKPTNIQASPIYFNIPLQLAY